MCRCQLSGIAILLLCQTLYSYEQEKQTQRCPIGFKLSYTKSKGDPLCYKLKEPEHFEDVQKDCVGNMYTYNLFLDLNLAAPYDIWTEYRSHYPGGLFVDTSLTNTSIIPEDKYNWKLKLYDLEDECCVFKRLINYTSVRCSEMHYRYCIVEPYQEGYDLSSQGCEDLNGSVRFRSPLSICLTVLRDVRVTWSQARELCAARGDVLLDQGQIYANAPILRDKIVPMAGVESEASLMFCSEAKNCHGAMNRSNNVFHDVACERVVSLKNLFMNLTIDYHNEVMLTVNDTIDENKIICYSDVNVLQYTEVKKRRKKNDTFILSGGKDGNYWCSHRDLMNFAPTESNKILYVRNREDVKNTFALKFSFNETYDVSNYSKTFDIIWKTKIRDHLYDSFQKEQGYDGLVTEIKNEKANVFTNIVIKRLYLDFQTMLVHVTLDTYYMGAVSPESWEGVELLSMKPVYYCAGIFQYPDTPLGGYVQWAECCLANCDGDFMEGVTWISTDLCNNSRNTTISYYWENLDNFGTCEDMLRPPPMEDLDTPVGKNNPWPTTLLPTLPVPREEQLQQVLADLDRLVNNDSSVFVEDLEVVFDQLDGILGENDDLEIPAKLLHQLDQLGSTVVLDEKGRAKAVRCNIALLIANAQPNNPVLGFRISAVMDEQFKDDDFQFLSEEPNSTILNDVRSEVVVSLPMSVSAEQRRVSFVVFRNDRAFHSHGYAVNSRVLSVNIENVTQFHEGEVVDIHLKPMVRALARNESQSCAYWHFLENGTGYWSQEGCTFIRAREDGMLDTCRCDHLTHFAEVLVPRAVFSEANENALEIITIVGCILSIVGLIMIGVTALLFRSWRQEYSNKIWLQLSMAILILVLSFLIVIFMHFDEYDKRCLLLGVLLHYAVLASFCWMLMAAVLAYRQLVLVFYRDAPHKLLKAAAFSWGAPCIVVGVLISVSPYSYTGRFEEMTPSGYFCYPSGLDLWLTVHAPLSAILLTNLILFASIVRSVFVSRRIQSHGESNEALRCASVSCMLVFLFGLPWVFGLFAYNVVAAYLFSLTATFQGFILFMFFVVGNKKTRDLWLHMLRIKQRRRMPLTPSSQTNRNAELRALNAPSDTHKLKFSKPKVLTSELRYDETRFF